jgi:hypothetical protein
MASMRMPEAEQRTRRLILTMGAMVEALMQVLIVAEVAFVPCIMISYRVEYWMIGVAMASYDFGFIIAGLPKVMINLKLQTLTLGAVGVLLMLIDGNILQAILAKWGVFLFITIIRLT